MSGSSPAHGTSYPGSRRVAALAAVVLGPAVLLLALTDPGRVVSPLVLVLVATAIASELLAVRFSRGLVLSGWDWCYVLALVFEGPAAAAIIVAGGIAGGYLAAPYRPLAVLLNAAALLLPVALGGVVDAAVAPEPEQALAFTAAAALTTAVAFGTHIVLSLTFVAVERGTPVLAELRRTRALAGPLAIQAAIAVTTCAVYARYGLEATALALLLVLVFAYMTRLVVEARERTRAYANLSWGVLSGLVRTLDERDARTARHCAAVARFSRDIARASGFGAREQELAHTAGLLHDIGKFALSDRVMERTGELNEEDWRAIRRHPEIGAELLRDIGVYGPVAEIVGAHHERMDGRGYPARLPGDAIPPLARVVAVAEVYDTLTAPDTYRTPMTSFEALRELRRVAGTQLDPTYVEALAEVLSGRDTAYRHADAADFDRELDIQRRMNEAAAT